MTRRDAQRAQLLADGQRALGLIDKGYTIADIMLAIGGSRARLYRAMDAARLKPAPDPLLL